MIKKITFQNIFSFRDKVELDFTIDHIDEKSNQFIYKNNLNAYAKFLAIYGKNNVGKTNTLKAIDSIMTFITNLSNLISHGVPFSQFYYERANFFHAKSKDPIKYEIIFDLDIEDKIIEYKYGFAFNDIKIIEEYLYIKRNPNNDFIKVFCYENTSDSNENFLSETKIKSIFNDEEFKVSLSMFKNFPNNRLLLPFATNWNENHSSIVFRTIVSRTVFITNDFINQENHILSFITSLPKEKINLISNFVKNSDMSLDGLISETVEVPILNTFSLDKKNNNQTKQYIYVTSNKIKRPLQVESTGTIKAINYLAVILSQLGKLEREPGSQNMLIGIDEFDSSLHPTSSNYIIENILNLVKELGYENRVQFIFTTHDFLFLDDERISHKQILIVDKPNKMDSILIPISKTEINQDSKLSDQYVSYTINPNLIKENYFNSETGLMLKQILEKKIKQNKNFIKLMEKLADS